MKDREIEDLPDQLFRQAQTQFGHRCDGALAARRGRAPGLREEVTATGYKKKDTLSLNAFIFREHGVLIAHLLCEKGRGHILCGSERNHLGNCRSIEKSRKM